MVESIWALGFNMVNVVEICNIPKKIVKCLVVVYTNDIEIDDKISIESIEQLMEIDLNNCECVSTIANLFYLETVPTIWLKNPEKSFKDSEIAHLKCKEEFDHVIRVNCK